MAFICLHIAFTGLAPTVRWVLKIFTLWALLSAHPAFFFLLCLTQEAYAPNWLNLRRCQLIEGVVYTCVCIVCSSGPGPTSDTAICQNHLEFVRRCEVIGKSSRDCIDGKANDCQPEVQILTLNELNLATTSNFHKKGKRKSQLAVVAVAAAVAAAACCKYEYLLDTLRCNKLQYARLVRFTVYLPHTLVVAVVFCCLCSACGCCLHRGIKIQAQQHW